MTDSEACLWFFHVSEKKLQTIKNLLKENKELSEELLKELVEPPSSSSDTALMIPVHMTGFFSDHEFEGVEYALEKLGCKGTAEGFVKARESFEKLIECVDEDTRDSLPVPMTVKEWRQAQEDSAEEEDPEEEEKGEPEAKRVKKK